MRDPDELRVMPWWSVLVGLLLAVLFGWLVLGWLLGEADHAGQADTRAQLRIDAIRTGLTVVAGTGGGVALLLAARRQWIGERAQRHREHVAAVDQAHQERVQAHGEEAAGAEHRLREREAGAAEHDATERRVTELYTKAVELLGSDRAAVRLGGLYALERLAQENPKQRPTAVAVVCAYLRMATPDDSPHEAEVRRSAQRLLTRHLDPGDAAAYWPGVRLELTGARLVDFDASGCTLVDADLTRAEFAGRASFARTRIAGRLRLTDASFAAVTFEGMAGDAGVVLDGMRCQGEADFQRMDIGGDLSCRRARFGSAYFAGARLRRTTTFDGTKFTGDTSFRDVVFESGMSAEHAEFEGYAGFRRARFDDMAMLRWTVFHKDAQFAEAVFEGGLNLARARFHGTASFEGARLRHKPLADQARASASGAHVWPAKLKVSRLDEDWLVMTDD